MLQLSLARFFKFDGMLAWWEMNIPIFALFSNDTLQTRGAACRRGCLPGRGWLGVEAATVGARTHLILCPVLLCS